MKPITEREIPHLESSLRSIRHDLDNSIKKTRLWKYLFYLSLSGIIVCSLFALYFTVHPTLPWIPVALLYLIFALLGSVILSSLRYQHWLNYSDRLCYFARPMEIALAEAKNNQNDVQAPAVPAHSGFCSQVIIDEEVSS